nr:hypothetical protein [Tanacetum cinerariifolium]GFB82137.1 hypothetical protein [Tanacetum cinerariifolium]
YSVDLFCEAAGCHIMEAIKESVYENSYGLRELRNQFWNMVAYMWEKDLV